MKRQAMRVLGGLAAIAAVGRTVRHQAYIMGYGDTFYLLGAGLALALLAAACLKRADRLAGGGAH